MRLSDILAKLSADQIGDLARRIVPGADDYPSAMWLESIEVMLRNSGYVEHCIVTQKPPVLALLIILLEADGRCLPREQAQEMASSLTQRWQHLVNDGAIVSDDARHKLYRRLIAGAWANDLKIDASENSLLGLLRQELGMTQVEHYLVAHHSDVMNLFDGGEADYGQVVHDLLADGVLFEIEGVLYLPQEIVSHVRRALGVHIERDGARRLLDHISNDSIHSALGKHNLRLSGSKQERIERLIEALVPIQLILDEVHISDLTDLSRKLGIQSSGSKEQKIQRLIEHFDTGADLLATMPAPEPEVAVEPKELSRELFGQLFLEFTAHQLKDVLMTLGQRHSGGKDKLIERLWESPFSERTILRKFSNTDLQDAFRNSQVDLRGNKEERVNAILMHFGAPPGHSPPHGA